MKKKFPQRALTNIDILKFAKIMKIKNFRGVFIRNKLPKEPYRNESAVVKLDNAERSGTHWVAYKKFGNVIYYFDSFGNLQPPQELVQYFNNGIILYNYEGNKNFKTFNCGHLCLKFLNNTVKKQDVIVVVFV